MRPCGWLLTSILCLSGLGNVPVWAVEGTQPRWLSDWEEARKVACESGRPLFVVFRCEH